MKITIVLLVLPLLFAQACLPLLVGGVVGWEIAKDRAVDDAQHKEKMDVERAKLELMRVEAEKSKKGGY